MFTRPTSRRSRAFTLIELIAVIVVLGILSAVALPKYVDWWDDARDSADSAAIAGMKTAMVLAYVRHRVDDAPAGQWVDAVADISAIMETGQLPDGVTVVGAKLEDQRGNRYSLTAETASAPAMLTKDSGGGGFS